MRPARRQLVTSVKDAGYTGLSPFSLFRTLMAMTCINLNLTYDMQAARER